MLSRRRFLKRTLQSSSLLAMGGVVPGFLANTARAAKVGKDTVLVVLEMTGGNDGLNTVVPYADDNYHRARPTLRLTKEQVVRVDDHVGLNPGMRSLDRLLGKGQLAVVQGVGYPNPDRSHFESMDIWQMADLKRQRGNGWLGRTLGSAKVTQGQIPGIYVGTQQLPLAMVGSSTGVPTIHPSKPYDLELSTNYQTITGRQTAVASVANAPKAPEVDTHLKERRRLIEDLALLSPSPAPQGNLQQFVQRSAVQTYSTVDRLRQIMEEDFKTAQRVGRVFSPVRSGGGELAGNLNLVGQMIAAEFGTRIFYVSIGGFDTHANQFQEHQQLLQQVADAISSFFAQLEQSGHAQRVLLMTFSEFGRRVQENGSRGTDHGAASCLFVAGPAVKSGVLGKHPSLAPQDLLDDDLKHQIDFRQVYGTLLDGWLGCPSQEILGAMFEPIPLLKQA